MDSKHDDQDVHHDNMNLGIGRSYECVFCKRGFNTAQALGGHMNIHRKDRARNKPPSSSSSSSSSTIFNYNISSNNHIIHPHHFYNHHQMNSSYDHHQQQQQQQFMIHQISANQGQYSGNPNHQAGFGYDQWSMSLINMQVEENIEKMGRRRGQEDQELDLELRL